MQAIKILSLVTLTSMLWACSGDNTSEQSQSMATMAPAAEAMPGNIIEGVVTSANGAEAGVWVIAETHDFDTRFARIVVTNDEGRYLIPDLPEATYDIWVRGYGLVDSEKICSDTRLQS